MMADPAGSTLNYFEAQRDQVFNSYNYGDEQVGISAVPVEKFAPCTNERFIAPTGDWPLANRVLDGRLVILVADVGTGRRTAALRLLEKKCGIGRVSTLDPDWSRPRSQLLPTTVRPEEGYLLDLSEPTEEVCTEEFARKLYDFVQNRSIYVVVIATPKTWVGALAAGVEELTIRIGSPDAQQLAISQLYVRGSVSPYELVADEKYSEVWKSSPKAGDVRRLVDILMSERGHDPQAVVAEYMDWRNEISEEIPDGLGSRALWWSAAFCNGGQRTSILQMADALRRSVGEIRTPVDILTDHPTSRRLLDAHVEVADDRAGLGASRHGFAGAVSRHLWEEYRDQTGLLTNWIVDQVVTLPAEDAERVIDAIFELVVNFRDDVLLRRLRDTLVGDRRYLAVRVFTWSALDPRFGRHMRERLNTWIKHSPSQATVELVTEVCGGQFGVDMPDRALVRLRRAALLSRPGSKILDEAVNALAQHHPAKVLNAISTWLSDVASEPAGIRAFLALASRQEGAQLLCSEVGFTIEDPAGRKVLIRYFEKALADPECSDAVHSVLESWADLAEHHVLPTDEMIDLIGTLTAPRLKDRLLQRFIRPDAFVQDDIWSKILDKATDSLWRQPQ
ncbi:hypothetical protein ACFXO9_19710 [Nocardia tengchongensis]|uniref:hypothetical protein n=1 Tax=Nocardia tengchongensis TaxID=2055889 RepID=UPI003689CADB